MSSTDFFNPRHPHEPDVAPVFDAEGRCLICGCQWRDTEIAAWMNGVADFVEPMGFDREAACGPADLLPGLKFMREYIEALFKALDHRHETGDAEPYFQARHDLEMAIGGRA